VNHQIWARLGGALSQIGVGPLVGIVTLFYLFLLDPAPGVANHDDLPDVGPRQRQRIALEQYLRIPRGSCQLAHSDREVLATRYIRVGKDWTSFGADPVSSGHAVDSQRRATGAIGDDDANAGLPARADELYPAMRFGERGSRRANYCERQCDKTGCA
jgi:hypothetical protein